MQPCLYDIAVLPLGLRMAQVLMSHMGNTIAHVEGDLLLLISSSVLGIGISAVCIVEH